MRVYFRYDRSLLGRLCRAAYETVREVFDLEEDGRKGVPAMVGAVQTFGDLMNWHTKEVHVAMLSANYYFTIQNRNLSVFIPYYY